MDSLHQLPWMPAKIQIPGPRTSTTESEFLGVTPETHIFNELPAVQDLWISRCDSYSKM